MLSVINRLLPNGLPVCLAPSPEIKVNNYRR